MITFLYLSLVTFVAPISLKNVLESQGLNKDQAAGLANLINLVQAKRREQGFIVNDYFK